MRTAEVCDVCATFISAKCIIYNEDYLSSLDIAPGTHLDVILEAINDAFPALSGEGTPTSVPAFLGQKYIQTDGEDGPVEWIGLSTTIPNWGYIGTITTTTTTTSTTSTTTTAP